MFPDAAIAENADTYVKEKKKKQNKMKTQNQHQRNPQTNKPTQRIKIEKPSPSKNPQALIQNQTKP